jgi:hypothetical protein
MKDLLAIMGVLMVGILYLLVLFQMKRKIENGEEN